ncbi:hypothetical protein HPB50_023138 [Hyalomma asiaticum]|uniref:Uncharacterized protein n=1 Tax=Hyalomma asiaticum TaxID=266040 RepID=A0ACB7T6X7_HYAAI|nr:hypothetical protein HPB50_023138 [Hyalomma asiaticum]
MTSQYKRPFPAAEGYGHVVDSGTAGLHITPEQGAVAQDIYQGLQREDYYSSGYDDRAKRMYIGGTHEAAVVEKTTASSYISPPTVAIQETAGVYTIPESDVLAFGQSSSTTACYPGNGSTGHEPPARVSSVNPANRGRPRDSTRRRSRRTASSKPWIPLLVTLADETITAWDVDPKAVDEAVRDFCDNDGVASVKITATGCFVVHVLKSATVVKLQRMKTLLGAAVEVTLSTWYTRNTAKIRSIPLYVSNEEVLNALESVGVMAVRRAVSYTRLDNGDCIETPKNTVILVFAPEVTELPTTVTVEGEEYEIEPCQQVPVQCMNCFAFGHQARRCQSSVRCKLCAGYHHHHACQFSGGYLCVNCGGGHAATYSSCPAKQRAIAELESLQRR